LREEGIKRGLIKFLVRKKIISLRGYEFRKMENLEKLSNEQLIHLYKNQGITNEIKSLIFQEIDRRELELVKNDEIELDLKTKIKIIFTSLLSIKLHSKNANEYLIKGNKKAYKMYWRYYTIGWVFNIILLLLVAKYIIKPLAFQ
jgi:hypothetical protein